MHSHLSRYRSSSVILLLLLASGIATAQDSREKQQPTLELKEPTTVSLEQRHTEFVPGSNQTLSITISDITGKMLLVTVRDKWSGDILRETPIGLDEEIEFAVAERKFGLMLSTLENKLVGDDSAKFTIVPLDDAKERKVENAGAASAKYGDVVQTNVSGDLKFDAIRKYGSVKMHIGPQDFELMPHGGWCWLSRDEILKIISASDTTVVYRLYHPVPMPRPF